MLTKNKIPFVNENDLMKKALKTLNQKKLGFIVVANNYGLNTGIFTDGDELLLQTSLWTKHYNPEPDHNNHQKRESI